MWPFSSKPSEQDIQQAMALLQHKQQYGQAVDARDMTPAAQEALKRMLSGIQVQTPYSAGGPMAPTYQPAPATPGIWSEAEDLQRKRQNAGLPGIQ